MTREYEFLLLPVVANRVIMAAFPAQPNHAARMILLEFSRRLNEQLAIAKAQELRFAGWIETTGDARFQHRTSLTWLAFQDCMLIGTG